MATKTPYSGTRITTVLVVGSFVAHAAAGYSVGFLPKQKKTDSVAIALAESKKKEEAKKPPPEPPKPAEVRPKAKVAAPAPKAEAPPAPEPKAEAPPPRAANAADSNAGAMDGFADLGFSLSGGGSGGGGMAVPTGRGNGPTPASSAKPVAKKVTALAPAVDTCTEDPVKPKLEKQVQPAYTLEGRQANVEGPIKLEVTVDEAGKVIAVNVVKGLGFGLDEAAVTAAKQWVFTPATRCGKAVTMTVKPTVRFQLGS